MKINKGDIGFGLVVLALLGAVVTVCWVWSCPKHKDKDKQLLVTDQSAFEQCIREGRPARVAVTATWQMPILSKYGYVPDERFTWSGWSGPPGCYELPAAKGGGK
ncbi:MAG: hypothetical protein FD189_1067 [Elusimicrobia bacterium]|nr:MAG: hypothetical protein FD189_1067 [Elusimicrobiota bacterium]